MSRLNEVIKTWKEAPPYEGVRVVEDKDIKGLDEVMVSKIELILEVMEWPQFLFFNYDNLDRVVAPFVLGLSFENNPLVRGFQNEGYSRSGKGKGWRVFQVIKMEGLENFQDYFIPNDFVFDRSYPWVYKVIKML